MTNKAKRSAYDNDELELEAMNSSNSSKDDDFAHNCRKYFREHNEVTGIHGLRYLTEKRSRCEKIFWALIMLFATAGCIYMIYEIINKFVQSPVIVSFATTETPIFQIPFPAVTICPETKTDRTEFNYTNIILRMMRDEQLTAEETKDLSYVAILCDSSINYVEESQQENFTTNDFYERIDEIKLSEQALFGVLDCKWLGKSYDCSELFVPTFTDGGVCYSFNILDRSELFENNVYHYGNYQDVKQDSKHWNTETGYNEDASIFTYPRRALFSGADNALSIVLTTPKDDVDISCTDALQGYRIILHNPTDLPRLKKHYFRIPLNYAAVATVQPSLMFTSEQVQSFAPSKRQCFFQSEKKLTFFKLYTQSNCQLECLTKFTLEKCGCVGFFMPRTADTPICGLGKQTCMRLAENELNIMDLIKLLNSSIKEEVNCDCKPLCTDLNYDAETSQSEWDYYNSLIQMIEDKEIQEFLQEDENMYVSKLSIYFKSEQFLSSERNELYGISDLISNFGGLIGLFTGFSMITMVEIIYFLSLRLYCNNRLYGKWSGPPS